MSTVTVLNGNSSTVGGAALFTATTNSRLLINFIKAKSPGTDDEITMRWGNSVNYNQVSSVDVNSIGRQLAQVYISNNDTWFDFFGYGYFPSNRLTRGFHACQHDNSGMTTTMAYPLELYLKSGEIFDLTCDQYSIVVITEI
jgi:hypothetical protein